MDATTLADLRTQARFCVWQTETVRARSLPTKVPYGRDGHLAMSSNNVSWMTWAEAEPMAEALRIAALEKARASEQSEREQLPERSVGRWSGGIGLFLGPIDNRQAVVGIDLDTCIGDTGIDAWALEAMRIVGGYAEISPSGTGAKIFALMNLEDKPKVHEALRVGLDKTGRQWKMAGVGAHRAGIEIYLERRFFAVTGDSLGSDVLAVLDAEKAAALVALADATFGKRDEVQPSAGGAGGGVGAGAGVGAGKDALPDDLTELGRWNPVLRRVLAGDLTTDLGDDKSRSAVAFRILAELKRMGFSQEAAFEVVQRAPGTADWAVEKGMASNWREMRRSWDASRGSVLGVLPTPEGMRASDPYPYEWVRGADDAEGGAGTEGSGDYEGEPGYGGEDESPLGGEPDAAAEVSGAAYMRPPKEKIPLSYEKRGDTGDVVTGPDGRHIVKLRVPVHETVDAAERAVLASGIAVFQRGQVLVRPVREVASGSGGRTTTTAALRELGMVEALDVLSQAAQWVKWDARSKGWVKCDPTSMVANVWLGRAGKWTVPRVAGIVTVPTMRPDGSLLTEPGLDAATGLYLMPDPEVKMPAGWADAVPVKADAEEALGLLEELIREFPFVDDVDRAAALSGIMTPVLRGAMGARPLHMLNAPEAGTGKSYLTDVMTMIPLGRPAPSASAGKTEEEMEKRLGAMLLGGIPIGVLDNLNGRLEGTQLAQAIDRPYLSIRVLGLSEMREMENSVSLYANGNNIEVVGEMVRRVIEVRLDPEMEQPETRVFAGNPLAMIAADRGKYLRAVLTIARAHALAGFPGVVGMRPLASFEGYGKYVRGSLRWLGKRDPAESIERTRREDPEKRDMRDMLRLWHLRFGTGFRGERTLKEALDTFGGRGGEAGFAGATASSEAAEAATAFRELVLRVAGKNGVVDPLRLSHWFRRREGRVAAGLKLRRCDTDGHTKGVRWTVDRVASHLKAVEGDEK